MAKSIHPESVKKKKLVAYIPMIIIILVVVTGSALWYKEYSRYISTDDAFLDSDKVNVSSKIMGRISTLHAKEGEMVKEGALLVELDSSELLAQRAQAVSMRNQSVAAKKQAEAKFAYDKQNLKVFEINLEKAKDDSGRAQKQFSGGVITQEKMDNIAKALEIAAAQYDAAKSQLNVSIAQVDASDASVKSGESQIAVVESQLRNTKIYSPAEGVLAKRWMLPGDIAQPGQSVYTISKNQQLWVTVYLEETKLGQIHLGQDVFFTVDAYGNKKFRGKIFFIGSNTASQFSLIPPSNASGNFTKVTQRVPLKVSIDRLEDGGSITGMNLLAGMSVVIKIIR